MADYAPHIRRASRRYGVPVNLISAVIRQESGGRVDARSGADAVGLMQIHLPSHPDVTRQQALDPAFNIDWGTRYLAAQYKRFGNWRQALAAYNAGPGRIENGAWLQIPETTGYVKSVLAMAGNLKNGTPVQAAAPVSLDMPQQPEAPDVSQAILAGLSTAGTKDFDPVGQLGELTMSVAASRAQTPVASQPGPSPAPQSTTPAPQQGNWRKWVNVPAARGSTSQPHQPAILSWVGGLAQTYGKPLDVWDNTTHSKTTTSGRVSAHYAGNAADIPATGAKLTRLGYIALVRAGMSPKEARVASRKGGLFNVGGYQIIFKTRIGGNHYDHLHVGIRG